MSIKHPNLQLACCCLLTASLLSACGGSSSSAGGADSRSYQQGVAHGTATTLGVVLDDLMQLQNSLAGGGAPVQTSLGRVEHIVVAANLAPRQREQLATSLRTFIDRIQAAKAAAEAATAGTAEAEAAQAAADDALRALRLVVAADTAARVAGGEAAQRAAIEALTQVAGVAADAPAARDTIDAALNAALTAAQAEVDRLQQELEEAQRLLGQQQGGGADVISGLTRRITNLQASLTAATSRLNAATSRLNALNAEFGDPPSSAALRAAEPPTPRVRHHPHGETAMFDVTPDPVVFDPDASNPAVFTPRDRNSNLFPGRGVVFRGNLRRVAPGSTAEAAATRSTWVYDDSHRLVRMGHDPEPSTSGISSTNSNANTNQNWDPDAGMAFQYQANGGFTMFFGDGGDGVVFNDMRPFLVRKSDGLVGSAGAARNLEISFFSPEADPFRTPHTNYWLRKVPALITQSNLVSLNLADTFDPVSDQGRYEMLLSNYAGINDQGTESAADDAERRRLSYAAYGLFQFVDHLLAAPRVGRVQIFHYGVDAFSDDDGRGTADLAGNDTIEGTFRGSTMGWMVMSVDKTASSFIRDMYRLRGDVELRACIGGANCAFGAGADDDLSAARIAGTITNLETAYANRAHSLYWTRNPLNGPDFRNRTVELQAGVIADDGTYSGAVDGGSGTRAGEYEGAFYGPVGAGLETAGTWWVAAPDWAAAWDGLIGSFGAVCTDGCRPASP